MLNSVLSFLDPQHGQEGLLRNFDRSYLFHTPLAGLLLFQQLALARHVTAVSLRRHVFAQRLNVTAGDNLPANCSLYRNIEHLPRYQFPHLLDELATAVLCIVTVHDNRQRIDTVTVNEHVEPHEVGRLEAFEMIIE